MRREQVRCDGCSEQSNVEDAKGWLEVDGEDLCPRCADARALEDEHDPDATAHSVGTPTMTEPLMLRSELDEARCQHPGCTDCRHELELHPSCHTGVPLWAVYHKGGELELTCSKCDETVCRIAVAG